MPPCTEHHRATPEVALAGWSAPAAPGVPLDELLPAPAAALGHTGAADPSNDPDDIAAWYPAFLALFLLGLVGLGGLWVVYFAI